MLHLPFSNLHRRRFMRRVFTNSLAPVGIATLPEFLFGRTSAAPLRPIESCILIMYYGGPSHIDTWDMKPHAAREIRGEFKPISTSVPGRFVCEHLELTSRIVDRLSVIRSMHHPMTNHNSAMYESLIGRLPTGGDVDVLGADRNTDFPNHGAVLSYLTAAGKIDAKQNMPLVNVALPHVMHNVVNLAGQNAGFLGAKYDPFQIERDPNSKSFRIDELDPSRQISTDRQRSRRELLATLGETSPHQFNSPEYTENQARAWELIGKSNVRRAFQIGRESRKTRDRYGRHKLGQSMLLARRLVEAGVRFINVNDKVYNGQTANWDCHQDNFARHRELLPPADQAFTALIMDLEERNLLDTTLVIAMGEFGRTPRINRAAGRDHWPDCYSVVLAGGGVNGGSTFGESDRNGAFPISDAVMPSDLSATIFWRFGIDHRLEVLDPLDRPFPLADGSPMKELFSS